MTAEPFLLLFAASEAMYRVTHPRGTVVSRRPIEPAQGSSTRSWHPMPTQAIARAYPVRFPGIPLMGATVGSVDLAAVPASAARSAATRAAPVGYGREAWYCHRRGPRKTRYQSWHQGPRAWRPRSACWICWCPRFPWTPGRGCRRAAGYHRAPPGTRPWPRSRVWLCSRWARPWWLASRSGRCRPPTN